MKFRLLIACVATSFWIGAAAQAQLLSSRVTDDRRECVYVGSDQMADGQVAPRTAVMPASQPCPDIAPFRDPNRQAPGNAALIREASTGGRRECVYTQGGIDYVRNVPISQRCAMTPDLLDRATAASDSGTLER